MPALTTQNPPPGLNVSFYSALLVPDISNVFASNLYFAEKDFFGRDNFNICVDGDKIPGQLIGSYPANGVWMNTAFMNGFFNAMPDITCETIADSGINFCFAYAPDGDLLKLQGAAFTFVKP